MSDLIVRKKTALTGGGASALDGIDGAALQEGEFAFVMVSDVLYVYRLNATSGAAESSPNIIAPDANGGNKRWILQDIRTPLINVSAELHVTAATHLDEGVSMSGKAPKASPVFTGNVLGSTVGATFANKDPINTGVFNVGGRYAIGNISLLDNQSITITMQGGVLVNIYNASTGAAALFWVSPNSATITVLGDVSSEWVITDVDSSKLAIFQAASVITIKNYCNDTRVLSINVFGGVVSVTAPA
ncbi:MAG: hypothetical protein WC455_17560 [Dehalococcoidia bacterium]|jgi:hypothetical protein